MSSQKEKEPAEGIEAINKAIEHEDLCVQKMRSVDHKAKSINTIPDDRLVPSGMKMNIEDIDNLNENSLAQGDDSMKDDLGLLTHDNTNNNS